MRISDWSSDVCSSDLALQTGGFRHRVDSVFNLLGVVPVALCDPHQFLQRFGLQVADVAFDRNVAELIALALFHHIGDNEIAAVGRKFRDGGSDEKNGIAVGKIELTQILRVKGLTIGSKSEK